MGHPEHVVTQLRRRAIRNCFQETNVYNLVQHVNRAATIVFVLYKIQTNKQTVHS